MNEPRDQGEPLADEEGWLLASTACPACHERYVVQVREVLAAKPLGTFSLAGSQMKFSAVRTWVYRCTACGTSGGAEPKHPEQIAALREAGQAGGTDHP